MSSEQVTVDRQARARVEDAILAAWLDRYSNSFPTANFTGRSDLHGLLAIPEGVQTLILSGTQISKLPKLPVSMLHLTADTCPLTESAMNQILIQLDENGQRNGFVDVSGAGTAPTGQGLNAANQIIARGWTIVVAMDPEV